VVRTIGVVKRLKEHQGAVSDLTLEKLIVKEAASGNW
jgi:hypothetical protein